MTTNHYRMYMEYKGLPSDNFIAKWWNPNGITITHGDGYWMGKHENSVIVDYVAHDYGNGCDPQDVVERFCIAYCEEFDQECVMVTKTPVDWDNIGPFVCD